jgi:tRNA A37 threonylcarbamoyladenosine biosynthesis protein TsaE
VIEWPERILEVLPRERLNLKLSWVSDSKRGFHLEAVGAHNERILNEFRRATFGG